ncbi:MAG TPA: hypothetical protein VFO63_13420, partial [Blastocatellia bacterium]|nr:hypothetical protein [Blastocatellia bacterium]
WLSHEQLRRYTKANPKKTVKKFLSVLGPLNVDAKMVRAFSDYLRTDDAGNIGTFTPDDLTVDKKVRGLVHLIMCLSEFQLN